MTDNEIPIGAMRQRLQQFVASRQWEQYHSPKNLAISIAIEAAELMEHFQWSTTDGSQRIAHNATTRSQIADELADILIYCLHFANATGIDISSAIATKLAQNEARFPAGFVPRSADESDHHHTEHS
jgi:dCTP diphosphatase